MKYQFLLLTKQDSIAMGDPAELKVTVVHDVELALEKLHQYAFDAIIYDDSLTTVEENKLQKVSRLIQEDILLAEKAPDQSWENCIHQMQLTLKNAQVRKVFITDDALKMATFNICLN